MSSTECPVCGGPKMRSSMRCRPCFLGGSHAPKTEPDTTELLGLLGEGLRLDHACDLSGTALKDAETAWLDRTEWGMQMRAAHARYVRDITKKVGDPDSRYVRPMLDLYWSNVESGGWPDAGSDTPSDLQKSWLAGIVARAQS